MNPAWPSPRVDTCWSRLQGSETTGHDIGRFKNQGQSVSGYARAKTIPIPTRRQTTKKSQFHPKADTATMALSPGSFVICSVWEAEQGAGAGRVSPEWTQSLDWH